MFPGIEVIIKVCPVIEVIMEEYPVTGPITKEFPIDTVIKDVFPITGIIVRYISKMMYSKKKQLLFVLNMFTVMHVS